MQRTVSTLLALLLLAGCSGAPADTSGDGGGAQPASAPASSEPAAADDAVADDAAGTGSAVTFKVTTTGDAQVTWGTIDGVSQEDIGKGTWTKDEDLPDIPVASLMVVAVNFTKSQTGTCEILIDGVSKSKQSGKGNTASANCDTDGS